MAQLPSGLKTFEASDTVRRSAQNENIEVLDRFVVKTSSSNVAKNKRAAATAGVLNGLPTAPWSSAAAGDGGRWALPAGVVYPQSLTVDLGLPYARLEGLSFGGWPVQNAASLPKDFIVESSPNGTDWVKAYDHAGKPAYAPLSYLPLSASTDCRYVRLTVKASASADGSASVSCLSVFSASHGNRDLDPLDDERSWGLNARLQGLVVMGEGAIQDDGAGKVSLDGTLIVMNPASGSYVRVSRGSFTLGPWDYLYVDLPYGTAGEVPPQKGTYLENGRPYDHKNRFVLAQRNGVGLVHFNLAPSSRLVGTNTLVQRSQTSANADYAASAAYAANADKVDGIHFSAAGGRLQFNDGTGWKGVGIKQVLRGETSIANPNDSVNVPIPWIDRSKSFLQVTSSLYQGKNDAATSSGVYAVLFNDRIYLFAAGLPAARTIFISWEVIEFA
ncbi:discoidin domain-containing protein [Paenibacillus albicereus]|uniref:Discoidin domain-containing protein n=1 Tax=Paenibacillus albicereus TaxID=2726185 RepID=A0A6H2GWF8_9BACL|nr:discoidin domain-containing protein [Paenibacillus albicereus]QJC51735.1 discoidin domain-containing protein [Paenibacillus albicereus]